MTKLFWCFDNSMPVISVHSGDTLRSVDMHRHLMHTATTSAHRGTSVLTRNQTQCIKLGYEQFMCYRFVCFQTVQSSVHLLGSGGSLGWLHVAHHTSPTLLHSSILSNACKQPRNSTRPFAVVDWCPGPVCEHSCAGARLGSCEVCLLNFIVSMSSHS